MLPIRFDSHQQFQVDAVEAAVDLFEGQPLAEGRFEVRANPAGTLFTDLGIGNDLQLSDDTILKNLQAVQKRNGLPLAQAISGNMHFSIEMETGTGKTYVYLRTAFELNAKYGFTKFVVVVPTVAIREGVLTTIELTRNHFQDLYERVSFNHWVYHRDQLSRLRQFATNSKLQFLIINIDSFNRASNVMNMPNESLAGEVPIDLIRATAPIVILDEPQNMESDNARAAISSLNPLCTLRYSATHRDLRNPIYRLDPVAAYEMRLVKRIEVLSIIEDGESAHPHIRLIETKATSRSVSAKLEIDCATAEGPVRRKVTIRDPGTDLLELSGGRPNYENYIVDEINSAEQYIAFRNGTRVRAGETYGPDRDAMMRAQLYQTVREHLDKELRIRRQLGNSQMKVLSLVFIDRVANYVPEEGKIRHWFNEAYEQLSSLPVYEPLNLPPLREVHGGYFSEGKAGPKDTRGNTKEDDDTYQLIMRDKERLLDPDVPLRFIFSHSALREGWDNPNVFQICTLNETFSEVKKRQEIGRGLRLPVLVNGERCHDENVNRLTVVANESYEEFARALQTEIESETGVQFGTGRIKNARHRRTLRLKKDWSGNPDFDVLWSRISRRTRFIVDFDPAEIVAKAAASIKSLPPIKAPTLKAVKGRLDITLEGGVTAELIASASAQAALEKPVIPDVLGFLQRQVRLPRAALLRTLQASERYGDLLANPQAFLDAVVLAIRDALADLLVADVTYELIDGEQWEARLFEDREIESFLENIVDVDNSIYDAVIYDSNMEKAFAKALNARDDIRLFFKLPGWFIVDTPVGTYNPDWAIVKDSGSGVKLYLIRETKGTDNVYNLRGDERRKVESASRHFSTLGVDYEMVTSSSEV